MATIPQISKNTEKTIITNFLVKIFGKNLEKDGYNKAETQEFAESYLESFDEENTVNI